SGKLDLTWRNCFRLSRAMAGFNGRRRRGPEPMVSYRERRTTALCAVAAGLLAVVCARWGLRPLPPLAVSPVHVHFEGSQALEYTRVMAEEFPDRVTGTLASHRAANYLCTGFHKLGYQVSRQAFSMWLHG